MRPLLTLVGEEDPPELRRQAERWLAGTDGMPDLPDCRARIEELATLYRLASSSTDVPAAFALLQSMVLREVECALQRRAVDRVVLDLTTAVVQGVDVFDGAPSAYFTLDANCRIISANRAAANLFLADQTGLKGQAIESLLKHECKRPFLRWLRGIEAQGFDEAHELTTRGSNRVKRNLCALAKRSVDPVGWLLMIIDVTTEDALLSST